LKELANDPAVSDTKIVAIAIDTKSDLQKMADNISKTGGKPSSFIFLSDPEHRVISRYGILNESSKGLPHPATYVIDKHGIVRWKFTEVNYRIRPTNQQILSVIKNMR
jgi:peroxiredoxin